MADPPQKRDKDSQPGIGVDAQGGGVIDPTTNVRELVLAESKYQDGMRNAQNELVQARLNCLQEKIDLRAEHGKEMSAAESRRVDEQAQLRADFANQLSSAEAKRIDAIRAVDVNAVAVASQRAADQATVLATQVAQSAEALRALVATTANTVNQSQQQLANTLSTRITTLEQAQYKGEGQSGVRDPQLVDLLAEVKALRDSRANISGKNEGYAGLWALIVGGGMFVIAAIAVFLKFGGAQ